MRYYIPSWSAALSILPVNPQRTTINCLTRRLLAVLAITLLISAGSSELSAAIANAAPDKPSDNAPFMALATSESFKALSPHARQCIQSRVEAIKYGVRSVDTVEGAPRQAHNPAMGYDVDFERERVHVKNSRPNADAWNLTLTLAAYGYEGRLQPVQPAEIISENNRLTYIRGDIREWYVNTPAGIEQGFTVNRPPGQKGLAPLQFKITVGGDLQPRISADKKNIDLYNASGKRMLTYRKLIVTDADGKVLPAHMTAVAATANKTSAAILIAVNDASAAYPIIVDPVLSTPKLTAADGMADDQFGYSVSVSGDTVVVGAVGNDENGSESGAAYIFDRNQGGANNWGQTAKLTAPDGAEGDEFGISVDIAGNTVVVGARHDDDRGSDSGSAYIFYRNQGGADNWGHIAKLTAADGAMHDQLGYSVAITGDTVVVGAFTKNYIGTTSGAVYIFDRNQGGDDNWGQTTKLASDDLRDWDQFGYSVAISGDTVVVGARFDDDNGFESGSAYVFDRNQGGAGNWGQIAKLTASDGEPLDIFGSSVAISGNTAVVGALEDKDIDLGDYSGSAYIFDRNQGGVNNWGQTAKVTPSGWSAQDLFGRSVAISGDTVVVGAHWDDGIHLNSGSAHIFERDQGGADNWGRAAMLTAADAAEADAFGWAVAINGNTVVVGAWLDDDNGADSGSVYMMDGMPVVTVTPTSGLTTSEDGGSATFTVVLNSPPTADVTIGLSSSDDSEGTVSPVSLTFTSSNWDQARTVTVTGADDSLADGDQAYTIITSACVSSDTTYDGIDPADVTVTNTDDDTPGVTISPTSGLTTSENGGSATFTVVLDSPPAADVTIDLSSSDDSEGTVSPAALTFTGGNWNQAQTVTVTGQNDDIEDGDQAYTIITSSCVSSDAAYDGIDPADVTVTNTDDDTPGVTVSPTSGLTTSENGGSATFTVVLDSPPAADVTIDLSSNDDSEGTVSPVALTFTGGNWNQAQTVTVTGENDDINDGDQAYTITTSICVSSDTAYDGINPADVTVTNTDDDTNDNSDDDEGGFMDGNGGGGGSSGCFITTLGK